MCVLGDERDADGDKSIKRRAQALEQDPKANEAPWSPGYQWDVIPVNPGGSLRLACNSLKGATRASGTRDGAVCPPGTKGHSLRNLPCHPSSRPRAQLDLQRLGSARVQPGLSGSLPLPRISCLSAQPHS